LDGFFGGGKQGASWPFRKEGSWKSGVSTISPQATDRALRSKCQQRARSGSAMFALRAFAAEQCCDCSGIGDTKQREKLPFVEFDPE